MGGKDLASRALLFSEEEIYLIAGYLAKTWKVPDNYNIVKDVEKGITAALTYVENKRGKQ